MKRSVLLIYFTLISLIASAVKVSNATFRQVGKMVQIEYDIDKKADVSIYLYAYKERIYGKKLEQVTGDVGRITTPGHHKVLWNVQAELGELNGNDCYFRIEAKEVLEDSFYFTIDGGFRLPKIPYAGITIGQEIKHFGWFASFSTGFDYTAFSSNFECDEDGEVLIEKDGVKVKQLPFYTGKRNYTHIGAIAGPLFRFSPSFGMYLGLGYSYWGETWELEGGDFVRFKNNTFSGVSCALGAHINIKKVIVRLGISSTNFKTIEANIGVGYAITK